MSEQEINTEDELASINIDIQVRYLFDDILDAIDSMEADGTLDYVKPADQNPDPDSESDSSEVPDMVNRIYKSMSNVVETLNTDNILLKQEARILHYKIDKLRLSQESAIETFTSRLESIEASIENLKRYSIQTRNLLIATLEANKK